MSPVFIDTQRLSYDNYGSKNDRFGWPLNRRYEKCQIFANLNDFNFFCFLNETVSFWTRVQCQMRFYYQITMDPGLKVKLEVHMLTILNIYLTP